MQYTALVTAIEDTCENEFEPAQIALFVQQAEQAIYNVVQLPSLRKNVSGAFTAGNMFLSAPDDFISPFSLAVEGADGSFQYLLNKDVNFIREAYPSPADTGLPKFYAIFGPRSNNPHELSLIVGPTPDASYDAELHYYFYPESIVTSGATWLGDTFDSALLNRALVEAVRFMKADETTLKLYTGMADASIALLKNLGDGKLRRDAYRSGQVRDPVR